MPIYGKILGAIIGFEIARLPGALIGCWIGHLVDRQETYGSMPKSRPSPSGASTLEAKHLAFFTCVFSMLAKLAKADGVISADEIKVVERVMREDMGLDPSRQKLAKNIFRAARASTKSFEAYAEEFYRTFSRDRVLLENLLDILIRVSIADGSLVNAEEQMLRSAARIFHMNDADFERLRSTHGTGPDKYYRILGCTPQSSVNDIKRNYRRLVKENHPDSVRAQGQPEEFIKLATEKFRAIQEAYEAVRGQRGFS